MSAVITHSLGASREEIVNLLRARGGVNADDLALSLGISKQCIRKHLDVLERDGFVEHLPERGVRGRPAHVYRLTARAGDLFPKRYDLFALSVLGQVKSSWGPAGLNSVFCGCAKEMINRLRPRLINLDFDARVTCLAELLDEEGYDTQVEKMPDGSYILTEFNCPVPDVAREYGQLCEREMEVYKELLMTEVIRQSRIAGGATRCAYRVLRPEKMEMQA